MKVFALDTKNVSTISPLLNLSAGFSVSIDDEIECLKSESGFGVFAVDENNIATQFIRCYSISSDVRLIEAFPGHAISSLFLLKAFLDQCRQHKKQFFRFDIAFSEIDLAEILRQNGFGIEKIFHHYTLKSENFSYSNPVSFEKPCVSEVATLKSLLNELHNYSESDLVQSLTSGTWRVLRDSNSQIPLGAILLRENPVPLGQWEIVEFVVDPAYRLRGIGTRFLASVLTDLQAKGAQSFFLKVEDKRQAAIRCYDKLGFKIVPDKSERWMYFKSC